MADNTTRTTTSAPAAATTSTPGAVTTTRLDSVPAVLAGVVLLIAGGVLMALAWNGAASLDYVQGQFPYLLSASLPGLALVILGSGVLVLQAVRRDAAERAAQMERLRTAITELTAHVGPRDPYDPAVVGEYRPRPRTAPQPAPVAAERRFEEGR